MAHAIASWVRFALLPLAGLLAAAVMGWQLSA
jgi:hypothetical protein